MSVRTRALALLACAALALSAGSARGETPLTTVRVAQGLTRPAFVTAPPGDTARVFIVEQRGSDNRGRIKILKNGVLLSRPFLTTAVLATAFEQGLLGLAFAPDYATTGRFYINYTRAGDGATIVARHTVSSDPDSANPTGTVILTVAQPFDNHNGGWLGFGPDGFLYVALGDGGDAGDPGDRAQNLNTLLGKMLRIDVSGATYTSPPGNPFVGVAGLDEIWAYGLRNPWRPAFDRLTGDLYIADVGQNIIEELNFQPASSNGGENYGWRCYEGLNFFTESATIPCGSCLAPGCPKAEPIFQYPHTGGRCSVTGGYVYRGCAIPDLKGQYFFADYCAATIYSGRAQGDTLVDFRDRTAQLAPGGGLSIGSITSFGEDARGELYICDQGGEVFKIVPASAVLESDVPALQAVTQVGGTMGSTGYGNALLPGVVPFADAGSRIRGVGYLKNALIRGCTTVAGSSLVSELRIGPFDVDLTASVDFATSSLTRRLIFRNRDAVPRALAYVDVIKPLLNGDADGATTLSPAGGGASARLAIYDTVQPGNFVEQRGTGSQGVTYSADVDTASQIVARVAADQPLGGGVSAGPGTLGLALGFDFGLLAPAAAETVTVVTRLLPAVPTGVEIEPTPIASARRLYLAPVPFRSELRLLLRTTRSERVRVDVFDVQGRRVRTILDEDVSPGERVLTWDGRMPNGSDSPAGIYFVRLQGGGRNEVQRAVRAR